MGNMHILGIEPSSVILQQINYSTTYFVMPKNPFKL